MTRIKFLTGISAVALTTAIGAGSAFAQTNTSERTNCPTTSTNGNVCTVTQGPNTNENSSTIVINSGSNNNVTVDQPGQLNTSVVQITGSNNQVRHQQFGFLNSARTDIIGDRNTSTIEQAGTRNSGSNNIIGNLNSARIQQGFNQGTGTSNSATITVGSVARGTTGNRISSTILQNGRGTGFTPQITNLDGTVTPSTPAAATSNNIARIITQLPPANASGTRTAAEAGGAAIVLAQDNQINQTERGNSATIGNDGGSTARSAANPTGGLSRARITQQNSFFTRNSSGVFVTGTTPNGTTRTDGGDNNPLTENQAFVSLSGVGNSGTIFQDGVQNQASVSVNRGGAGVSGASGTDEATGLTFTPGQAAGNVAEVNQFGQLNRVGVSVGFPVDAGFPSRGLGNRLTINQGSASALATGHSATVNQFGQLSTVSITQNDNRAVAGPTAVGGSANGTATVGQTQSGSIADISQGAFFSTLTVTQNGTNTALLNQGAGRAVDGQPAANGTGGQTGNNTLTVTQTDTGDLTAAPTPTPTSPDQPGAFDPAPAPTPTPTSSTARNYTFVAQAGRNNSGTVAQTATNASATLIQRRGSANLVATINQGTAAGFNPSGTAPGAVGATNVTAFVRQSGLGGSVDLRQVGTDLTATARQNDDFEFSTAGRAQTFETGPAATAPVIQVSQVGTFNDAQVSQSGSNSTATVDQRNNNTGTDRRQSTVVIGQIGGSRFGSNTAIARQTSTGSGTAVLAAGEFSGPEGDPARRTGPGTFGNSIEIRQTNDSTGTGTAGGNNSATVEQQGAGQRGEIRQTGRRNEAGILQDVNATNAQAFITQTGTDNTFFITQNAPNQFLRVTQTGSNNQTITSSGTPNGGTFSNTTNPFTPAP